MYSDLDNKRIEFIYLLSAHGETRSRRRVISAQIRVRQTMLFFRGGRLLGELVQQTRLYTLSRLRRFRGKSSSYTRVGTMKTIIPATRKEKIASRDSVYFFIFFYFFDFVVSCTKWYSQNIVGVQPDASPCTSARRACLFRNNVVIRMYIKHLNTLSHTRVHAASAAAPPCASRTFLGNFLGATRKYFLKITRQSIVRRQKYSTLFRRNSYYKYDILMLQY